MRASEGREVRVKGELGEDERFERLSDMGIKISCTLRYWGVSATVRSSSVESWVMDAEWKISEAWGFLNEERSCFDDRVTVQ